MRHGFIVAATLVASLSSALAQDAAKGEQVFNVCRPCHQVGPDAVNMLGPPLNGLDGRKAGSLPRLHSIQEPSHEAMSDRYGPFIVSEDAFRQAFENRVFDRTGAQFRPHGWRQHGD